MWKLLESVLERLLNKTFESSISKRKGMKWKRNGKILLHVKWKILFSVKYLKVNKIKSQNERYVVKEEEEEEIIINCRSLWSLTEENEHKNYIFAKHSVYVGWGKNPISHDNFRSKRLIESFLSLIFIFRLISNTLTHE